jgi:hypothetical protein
MTGTRGLGGDKPSTAPDATKSDSGLDAGSARARPATGTTPMTGTRGIPKPSPSGEKAAETQSKAPADPAATPAPAK